MPTKLSPVRRKLSRPSPVRAAAEPPSKKAPESPEKNAEEAMSSKFTKKVKLSSETLKAIFTSADFKSQSPANLKHKNFKNLIRDRIKSGRRFSLKNWRVYAAIDEAYNAPFNQITPTLIGKILAGDKKLTPEEVQKQLQRWGLSEDTLFTEISHPQNEKVKVKVLNRETFNKVLIPLVKSLVNARESKIVADRDNYPNFVYAPGKQTEENKAVGDVVTQIVETMSIQYGFKAVRRAAVHHALKYSFAIAFPAEAWHYEMNVDENGKEFTEKEGMRYLLPHPTRTAWDQNFRPGTFNTDTGCEWAMHWRMERFGDVDTNPAFYNTKDVAFGNCWWETSCDTYFESIYPCTMEFPFGGPGAWRSGNNREKDAAVNYSEGDHDKAVFTAELFMKLSPAQWGLGEYKHPIWLRFKVAGDDSIVYAEPVPYSPVLFMGSDADDSTSTYTASFALEGIPWQDLTSNILCQHLVAVKQNCMKVIPYDKTQLTQQQIQDIAAQSKEATTVTWIPVDPRDMQYGDQKMSDMFKPMTFPQVNTQEIIGTLNQVFNIMERALGMSAQEVGAIAGHIQTAEEIRTVSQNTSTRLDYLGMFVDEFDDAMKRQVYVGYQTFGDEDFTVHVGGVDKKMAAKLKEKYGFVMDEPSNGIVKVQGVKSKLSVDAFISSRENKSRINQPQIAAIFMQTIQVIAQNEMLATRVGPEELMRHLNRAARLAGMPEDAEFKLSEENGALAEMKQLMQQLQEFAKQITEAASKKATVVATKAAAEIAERAAQEAGETIVTNVGPAVQQVGQTAAAANETAQAAGQGVMAVDEQVKALTEIVARLQAMFEVAAARPPQTIVSPMDPAGPGLIAA